MTAALVGALRRIRVELVSPGDVGRGSPPDDVRRLQEWLSFHGAPIALDGVWGPRTAAALDAFRVRAGTPRRGEALDAATWNALVRPMVAVAAPLAPGATFAETIVANARRHAAQRPREVGGQNRGPWVRAYMDGHDGASWPWCAGFVRHVVHQAALACGMETLPVELSFSCNVIGKRAEKARRLHRRVATPQAGDVFLVPRGGLWRHTGIVTAVGDGVVETVEGNTDEAGSREGVCARVRERRTADLDFVRLT